MRIRSKRNRPLALGLALVLANCSQSTPQKVPEPEWEALADGSHLLLAELPDYSSIERCFPVARGFQCLTVGDINPKPHGSWLVVNTETRSSPREKRDRPIGGGEFTGYGCQIMIFDRDLREYSVTETISSKHGTLRKSEFVSQRLRNPMPFSKQEVEDYFEANSIDPEDPWLNCRRVAQLVVEGSFASLTSSDLTLETFASD